MISRSWATSGMHGTSSAGSLSCSEMSDDSDTVAAARTGFRSQVERFASHTNQLISAVFGDELVNVEHVETKARITANVPRTVDGVILARLMVDVWCCLDTQREFLAVETSAYKVSAVLDRAPILRFEYARGSPSIPGAHMQVHAHRGALSHLLSRAGHATPHSMESLHLPVGGDRFRPCIEDVIEFLVVDCRFDKKDGWQAAVRDGRERWRRIQLRTVVRDVPSEAVTALRQLGYEVSNPSSGPAPDHVDRLRNL